MYVDDGSDDGTLDALVKLAAADPSVRYLSFSRNFGKESAMLAGLRYATGDAVVIMDADLQHPPELIGRMLELYERGFDQVIARRNRVGDPATRTLFARAYYWLINRWADVELVDGVGDFRLLSRRAVDGLLELGEYNRFSKGLFAWIGFESILFEYENVNQPERFCRCSSTSTYCLSSCGCDCTPRSPRRARSSARCSARRSCGSSDRRSCR